MFHILWPLLEWKPILRSPLSVFTLSGMSTITLKTRLDALHLENTLAQDDWGSRVQEFMASSVNISNFA